MIKKNQLNKLICGGLFDETSEAEDLRRLQIIQGIRIHTCNNYGKSLEVIKNASKGIEKKLKLLTKVYYRYPNIKHPRFRPIMDQLNEIIDRLGFVPYDWSLQICCYCNLKELKKNNAKRFFEKINKKYNINQVYLEYYPVYNYELNQIVELNNFYNKFVTFGLVGYQNLCNRVFSNDQLRFLSYNSIKVIFIGLIGKGNQNRLAIKESFENLSKDEIINSNIFYLISSAYKYRNIYSLTHVSSLMHYEDLIDRLSATVNDQQKNSFYNQLLHEKFKIYYFDSFDQYGGYITFKQYLKRPKFIISKIKYVINSFIVASKFNNNFWG